MHQTIVRSLQNSNAGDRSLFPAPAGRRGGHPPIDPAGLLRILHSCGQFNTNQGGTERQARAVCSVLAARGHEVSVLTRATSEVAQIVGGVTVHPRIWAMDRVRSFGVTYLATAMYHLVRLGRKADVLHAHHLFLDAVAALAAGKLLGLPVVAKMAGGGAGGDLDRLRQTAGGAMLLSLLHRLDAVIAPSPTCRTELVGAGFPAERIQVIMNGVDTALFESKPMEAFSPPFPTCNGPAIVFTGRLIEAKGLLELLEAWPLLLREVPDARLILVGSGPLEAELRRRANLPPLAGRVHLAGEVTDVRPYLRAATAFVFPSWAEGLPNSLLEAMAMGLPCIASDIGPIQDAVTDGEEALLVPVRFPRGLAAAVAAVLSQPALAARLGHAARKRVEAEFSMSTVVDRLERLYRELCSGRRSESPRG